VCGGYTRVYVYILYFLLRIYIYTHTRRRRSAAVYREDIIISYIYIYYNIFYTHYKTIAFMILCIHIYNDILLCHIMRREFQYFYTTAYCLINKLFVPTRAAQISYAKSCRYIIFIIRTIRSYYNNPKTDLFSVDKRVRLRNSVYASAHHLIVEITSRFRISYFYRQTRGRYDVVNTVIWVLTLYGVAYFVGAACGCCTLTCVVDMVAYDVAGGGP